MTIQEQEIHQDEIAKQPVDMLLSIRDVQRILGCGRSTVYRLFDDGKLRSVKVGKSRRVWSGDVKAYINDLLEESGERLKETMSELIEDSPDSKASKVWGEINAS